MSDEIIISLIHNGDKNALDYIIEVYKKVVKIKARAYFLIGADKDDIIQEGMLGLYKAIRSFDSERAIAFRGFAEICIVRQMFSAIKSAARQKHTPLNKYISLSSASNHAENDTALSNSKAYFELLSENVLTNPEDIFIRKENKNFIEASIRSILSPLEKNSLVLFLEGRSYSEIAEILRKDEKSIDNALQRARKKVSRILRTDSLIK